MKPYNILLLLILVGMFFCTSCADSENNHVNSSLKLIPAKIDVEYEASNRHTYTYKYDGDNRLVEYVETSLYGNNTGLEDMETRCKIVYNDENNIDTLIISPRLLEDYADIDNSLYELINDTVMFEYQGQEVTVKYKKKKDEKILINPNREVVRYEYYGGIDNELKITNTYEYDDQGNILRIVINNGVDQPYIPYTYTYDKRNGIYKNVNIPQWFMAIMLDQRFNMSNNYKEYWDVDGYKWTMEYSYDKNDYPVFMKVRGDENREMRMVEAYTTFDYIYAE
jgi:hypothetical protein